MTAYAPLDDARHYGANGSAPNGSASRQERQAPTVTLRAASELKAVPIQWIWPGWLAGGKLHVLGGQPGTGKTTLAVRMAATVSAGGTWPDGRWSPVGNVVIWSGEDDPEDTLVPRLLAAGADLTRVFFVEAVQDGDEQRPFDPAKDIGALRQRITQLPNVKLIIVDPIVSAVSGDSHKNAETRRGLAPLVEIASAVGAALLGVTHFTKGTAGREPIERITGSLAFGALARVVMIAAKESDKDDGTAGRRIFARAKSNIGPDDGGFAYRLEQVPMPGDESIIASIATFGETIEGTARDMLAVAEAQETDSDGGALAEAREFLRDALSFGPVPVKKLQAAARDAGQAWRTVRRAQQELGIAPRKGGMDGGWVWALASEDGQQNPKVSNPDCLDTFGNLGHLRAASYAEASGR